MEKQSKYLGWISILLFVVIVFLGTLAESAYMVEQFLSSPFVFFREYYPVTLIALLLSAIPFLISYIKHSWKKNIIWFVFIASVLSAIGGFIQSATCTGKMCGLLGILIIIIAVPIGICFPLFYGIGVNAAPKRNVWMYLFLGIEAVAIISLSAMLATSNYLGSFL